MSTKMNKIRNIGIIAHIDAGKTTTSERFLYYAGKIHKLGSVDEGTTEMDYLEEEKERGITIISAVTSFDWKDSRINLIDTPGHVDFVEEVKKALFVIDSGVLVLCGTSHVQSQTESLFKITENLNIPLLVFINKMDRDTSSFEHSLNSLEENFKKAFFPVTLPLYTKETEKFTGIYHIFEDKGYIYENSNSGDEYTGIEGLNNILNRFSLSSPYDTYSKKIIDILSQKSDLCMELFLENENNLSSSQLPLFLQENRELFYAEIRKLTRTRGIFPCFCGSSLKNIAIHPLIDGIVDFCPEYNEMDFPLIDHQDRIIKEKPGHIGIGYVFKTIYDRQAGKIGFIRIYKGSFNKNEKIYIPNRHAFEKLSHIYHIHADKKVEIDTCTEGDIIACIGIKNIHIFDTILSEKKDLFLNKKEDLQPVISMKIEPKSVKDFQPLIETLAILAEEDPSFQYKMEEQSQSIIISGMGELHLEIIQHKIRDEFKIETILGKPVISYKESIKTTVEQPYSYKKEIKGIPISCDIKLSASPDSKNSFLVIPKIEDTHLGKVLEEFGHSCFLSGPEFGYPVSNVKIVLESLVIDNKPGREILLAEAMAKSLNKVFTAAEPLLLEPLMKIEIITPFTYFSDVYNDLLKRFCEIESIKDSEDTEPQKIIRTKGFLRYFFGYSTDLRTITSGKGNFSIEFFKFWHHNNNRK